MNPIDWAIVALVSVSVLLGLWRGLVRELLSLAGWIVGIVLAIRYAVPLGQALPFDVGVAEARTGLAALVIVLATVLAAGIVATLVGKLLAAVKLSGADRVLGALFGLLRAALVLLLVVLFAGRTALAAEPLWRESILLPPFEAAVRFASAFLPPPLAERIRT